MDGDPWRPGRGQKIEALYAWIAVDPEGGEGVCGASIGRMMLPLVGADRERIESLRERAAMTRAASGYPVKLVRFSRREDIEELP